MKKKLTLLIFLFPMLLMAQVTLKKNGTITFDVGGKKDKNDTVQKEKEPSLQPPDDPDDEIHFGKKKDKKKANNYLGTSNTSLTIGTGTQYFTTQTGLSYQSGDKIRISYSSDNYMEGVVSSYNDSSMVVSVRKIYGDGTYGIWGLDTYKEAPPVASNNTLDKKNTNTNEGVDPLDYKKDGIFKALVHAGINGSQIDGDGYAGYNLIGLDVGVDALIRFHKFLSVTVGIGYSMKGAKQKLNSSGGGYGYDSLGNQLSLFKYRANLDYVEIPIALNVQDKKFVMFSLGLSIGALVHYREQTEAAQVDTDNPPNGQPKKYDLSGFGMLNFVIHHNYLLGIKFSYSLISLRGPQYPGLSRVLGEYNNVLNFRFTYLMDKATFKKKH